MECTSRPYVLTKTQLARAWRLAYCTALEELPDAEVRWERDRWLELDAPAIAALCTRHLRERVQYGHDIPGGVSPCDLDRLWRCVDQAGVVRAVRADGLTLVGAMRLKFWIDGPRTRSVA